VSLSQQIRAPRPRTRSRVAARWGWAWVVLSSAAIAGYFATGSLAHLATGKVGLASTYAHRPWPVQIAFYTHISFAGPPWYSDHGSSRADCVRDPRPHTGGSAGCI
jgi:hypothetical protein